LPKTAGGKERLQGQARATVERSARAPEFSFGKISERPRRAAQDKIQYWAELAVRGRNARINARLQQAISEQNS
jgi:hypothetical protein